MKKELKKLAFVLTFIALGTPVNASFWSLWINEDEEPTIISEEVREEKKSPAPVQKSVNNDFIQQTQSTQQVQYTQPTQSVNIVNNIPTYDVNSINKTYGPVDYDTLQSERMVNQSEILNAINKWKDGNVNIFWENYRGNNVRIEMLRNNRDLKEMRLKFVQSQNMTSDPDGSISDMLNVVANQVMKRTCGKKAKQSIILYERPSVELERETAADGYKIMAKGTSIKEYGFRCIY